MGARIKAIIFDFDGVLIDSEKLKNKAWERSVQSLKIAPNKQVIAEGVGKSARERFKAIQEAHAITMEFNEFYSLWKKYYTMLTPKIKPIQSNIAFLQKASQSRLKIAMATSCEEEFLEECLARFKLKNLFDEIVSSKDVHESGLKPKPAPDIYELTAKKLGLSPENCVVIEDSHAGVAAATAAGMKCIGLSEKRISNENLTVSDLSKLNFNEIIEGKII